MGLELQLHQAWQDLEELQNGGRRQLEAGEHSRCFQANFLPLAPCLPGMLSWQGVVSHPIPVRSQTSGLTLPRTPEKLPETLNHV